MNKLTNVTRYSWRFAGLSILMISGCSEEHDPFAQVQDGAVMAPQADAGQGATDPFTRNTAPTPYLDATTRSASQLDTSISPIARSDAGVSPTVLATVDAASPLTQPPLGAATPAVADAGPRAARCSAATYQGTFVGVVMPLKVLPSSETVSGTIRLDLKPVAGQDRLTVTGKLKGVSEARGLIEEDTWTLAADVRASLNCATHQFEEGYLVDPGDGSELAEVYLGEFGGTLSDNPAALRGTWSTEDVLVGASGSWSALPLTAYMTSASAPAGSL